MTAFVAVCLTLTSPYVFKIGKSFLIWLLGILNWLKTEWNNTHSAVPSSLSSTADQSQTPLRQTKQVDYGTSQSSSTLPDGQHANGEPTSAERSGSVDHPETASLVSGHAGEQSVHTATTLPATENHPGSRRRSLPVHADQGTADALEDSSDSREFVWKVIESLLHRGAKEVRRPSTTTIVSLTVLFGLFVAQAIAGVFSAKIASDKAGLSSSKYCGIWQFNEDAGGESADRDDWYNYQKEARASQYARTCYNSQDPTEPFSCRIFYNQSIAYTTKTHQSCPFASSELCHDGLYSAVSFDTGYVDASVIGINSPETPKLRRTASCSPLNMSEPYVLQSSSGTNSTAYQYYYGPKDNTNYTFNTSGQPFEWLIPVYSVK